MLSVWLDLSAKRSTCCSGMSMTYRKRAVEAQSLRADRSGCDGTQSCRLAIPPPQRVSALPALGAGDDVFGGWNVRLNPGISVDCIDPREPTQGQLLARRCRPASTVRGPLSALKRSRRRQGAKACLDGAALEGEQAARPLLDEEDDEHQHEDLAEHRAGIGHDAECRGPVSAAKVALPRLAADYESLGSLASAANSRIRLARHSASCNAFRGWGRPASV
jgi:hypothetical protein